MIINYNESIKILMIFRLSNIDSVISLSKFSQIFVDHMFLSWFVLNFYPLVFKMSCEISFILGVIYLY